MATIITRAGKGSLLTSAEVDQNFVNLNADKVEKSGDTLTGRLNFAASTAGAASLRVPHGVAPTTPVNGDMWTTTAGVFARVNGATVGPLGVNTGPGVPTPVSANWNIVSEADYVVNSSAGALTATAPASPAAGAWFDIKDLGNAGTNTITINWNGQLDEFGDSQFFIDESYWGARFRFVQGRWRAY